MELILINESKLKIMLSCEDMKEYNLDNENMDYENDETRRAIWKILDEVKNKIGFNASGERIFIQVYSSRIGGCEMIITKLNLSKEAVHMQQISDSVVKTGEYSLTPVSIKRTVYSFCELELLIDVCKRLQLCGYSGHSEVYCHTEHGREYLLVLNKKHEICYNSTTYDELSFINEYGVEGDYKILNLGLSEHGTCLAEEKAVQIFASL